ncbi:c-type cytochrome domain-containing protein [Flagellimonas sp.]|uniref:c-type cytochrome domain-containing protein n=1 Tax=Flagellimonas sp. TaxID=2058762 RepID=UPI003BA8CFDA
MDILSQLLGRLHPLIVHLPIGFLVLGVLLYWTDRKTKQYTGLLSTLFLWAGIVSVLACISGFLLYQNEGYGFDTVKGHLWFGIITAVFCFALYLKWKSDSVAVLQKVSFPIMIVLGLVLISITGHKGGNITHGEGYLTEPLPRGVKKALGIPVFEELPIALTEESWENADLYAEVVHPILNNKCVSCHGPKQAKGELRLHHMDDILSGGENGEVIMAQNPDGSELFTRVISPKDTDGHMPPKEKEQLSKEEIAILKAWIEAGHPFEGSIASHGLDESLFEPFFPKNAEDFYPEATLSALPLDSLRAVKETGLHVEYLSKDSPWLRVTAINKPGFSLTDTLALTPINDFIVELDLSNTAINDSIYPYLGHLPHLTALNLGQTEVTDQGIEELSHLSHLKHLNLTRTGITSNLFDKLENFPSLQKVYVFGTSLSSDGPKEIHKGLEVDYGGYTLPKIASDSIIY